MLSVWTKAMYSDKDNETATQTEGKACLKDWLPSSGSQGMRQVLFNSDQQLLIGLDFNGTLSIFHFPRQVSIILPILVILLIFYVSLLCIRQYQSEHILFMTPIASQPTVHFGASQAMKLALSVRAQKDATQKEIAILALPEFKIMKRFPVHMDCWMAQYTTLPLVSLVI
jgi:hypothetical protein